MTEMSGTDKRQWMTAKGNKLKNILKVTLMSCVPFPVNRAVWGSLNRQGQKFEWLKK